MDNKGVPRWEMAIGIYMFYLNMTRNEACYALGIKGTNKSDGNKEKLYRRKYLESKNEKLDV